MNSNEIRQNRSLGLASVNMLYLCWLVLVSCFALGAYILDAKRDSVAASSIVYLIIISVHFLRISFRDEKIDWISPDLVYIFVFSLFHYGYIIPYWLGLVPKIGIVFIFESLMAYTLFVVNIGVIFFVAGYESGLSKTRSDMLVTLPRYIGVPGISWNLIGWIIMIIGLIFHFGTLVQVPIVTLLTDTYNVIMHMGDYVPVAIFFLISDQVFLLGATIYFVTSLCRIGKLFSDKVALVVIFGFMIFTLLEGHRGSVIRLLIVGICAKWYYGKRMKLRWILIIVAAMFFVIGVVRISRTTVGIDVTKVASEYKYQKGRSENNILLDSFVELGGTIRVVNATVGLVQNNYWWGRTILQSFVGTISRYITDPLGPPPSTWLTYHLAYTAKGGTGSSIIAEGYLNLGIPGVVIIMFFLGFFLRRLHVRMLVYPNPVNMVLFLIALGGAVYSVRQNLELAVPLFMRAWIICGILSYIFPFTYQPIQSQEDELATNNEINNSN